MDYLFVFIGSLLLEDVLKINMFGVCLIGFGIIYAIHKVKAK